MTLRADINELAQIMEQTEEHIKSVSDDLGEQMTIATAVASKFMYMARQKGMEHEVQANIMTMMQTI